MSSIVIKSYYAVCVCLRNDLLLYSKIQITLKSETPARRVCMISLCPKAFLNKGPKCKLRATSCLRVYNYDDLPTPFTLIRKSSRGKVCVTKFLGCLINTVGTRRRARIKPGLQDAHSLFPFLWRAGAQNYLCSAHSLAHKPLCHRRVYPTIYLSVWAANRKLARLLLFHQLARSHMLRWVKTTHKML